MAAQFETGSTSLRTLPQISQMSVLFIHSHYGIDERLFQRHAAEGRVRLVRERDLTPAHFAEATGLITTQHLDQVGLLQHASSVQALLARGGRWIFNGHMLRVLLPGLGIYVPLKNPVAPTSS